MHTTKGKVALFTHSIQQQVRRVEIAFYTNIFALRYPRIWRVYLVGSNIQDKNKMQILFLKYI